MPKMKDFHNQTASDEDRSYSPIDHQQVNRLRSIVQTAISLNPAYADHFVKVIEEERDAAKKALENARARGPNEREARSKKDSKAGDTTPDNKSLASREKAPKPF